MALSNSVQNSLDGAESSLRNALAFAARQERPIVCTQISKMISDIESIGTMDELLDSLTDLSDKNK
ncbi:hypothetical protein Syn7803C72_193 [Synechococcus phage ACG-2014d]|jgi:hypothetical protein|uniref:Uncharacterized protein n=1 Tax=Synechococcus phage ACG-2014d TaxID=1493509 RepID=A0A0E3I2K4_9CAUD|nr:hypothetical protein AAJ59_gp193 [Synechococcus phage ACG-2014d]YP_010355364.1 hypothetical protein M1M12_gp195 [Synechococcus phage ACG-2014d]AIX14806.1 hypothetical protein Syn7803C45_195 [Synechococcus phage ACG-2014d]AIX15023.1 hypothetical protein Syn7803C46_192 [Synechococcus phage ACG-2014d]AIX15450.1 hypothetical protein Syn7803C48_192 [Synechococcus phage ACG-2014d]AIX16099.1 hypothetical protein Syn7803C54_194 [Synechococcus phage ACG-2014d]AIX18779.1 hypothetical protein Syn7803